RRRQLRAGFRQKTLPRPRDFGLGARRLLLEQLQALGVGTLAGGDVLAHADGKLRLPVLATDERDRHVRPDHASVARDEALLGFVALGAALGQGFELTYGALRVVGMREFRVDDVAAQIVFA